MKIANDKRFLVKDLKSVVVAFRVVMREEGGGGAGPSHRDSLLAFIYLTVANKTVDRIE